jgi:hypothetical protein
LWAVDPLGLYVRIWSINVGYQGGFGFLSNASFGNSLSIGFGYSADSNHSPWNDFGIVVSHSNVTNYSGAGFGVTLSRTVNNKVTHLTDMETKPCDKPSKSFDIDFGEVLGLLGGAHLGDDGSSTLDFGLGGRSVLGFGISENTSGVYSYNRLFNR